MKKVLSLFLSMILIGPLAAAPKASKKAKPALKRVVAGPAPVEKPTSSTDNSNPSGGPTGGTGQANLGSMEVTGQAKDKVLIEKPTPEIKIDIGALVDSVTERTEKLLERPRPVPAEEDFMRFNHLGSDQTVRPWLPDLAEPPLISFRPEPSKTTVKGWRLEVTDDLGNIVQTLTGKGNAVDEIIWDGMDKDKKMIRVGSAYSFRFITVDQYNNAHTTLGRAFTLKNLKYEDKKNVYVEISNAFLYKDEKLAPDAQPYFERALDVLREYSRYPFSVEFMTDAPQGETVKSRQKTVTEKIAKDLLLPAESVKYTYTEIKDRGDITRFVIKLR